MIGSRSRNAQGFTLIEVIIAVAVFSITVVMALNLFIVFVQQQRRTLNQQELQNDARAVMELIAKDVREGSIDYEYYSTVFVATQTKLYSQLNSTGNNDCLVLRSSINEQIFYRLNGTIVERHETSTPNTATGCSLIDPTLWEKISPDTLNVSSFTFSISPTEDPFGAQAALACTIDTDCDDRWGTTCLDSSGKCVNQVGTSCYCYPQRFGEVTPLHPRVMYAFNMSRTSNQQTISQIFQTTVASRQFKNLDRLNSYAP